MPSTRSTRRLSSSASTKLTAGVAKYFGLTRFVSLHDGEPQAEIGVIRGDLVLAGAPRGERSLRGDEQREPGGAAERLLAGGEHDVDTPRLLRQLFAAHRAHAVDDDESAVLAPESGERAHVVAHRRRGVDVRDGEQFAPVERARDIARRTGRRRPAR